MLKLRRLILILFMMITFSSTIFANEGSTEQPKRIGIIGAGWMGGTLGKVWVKSGHEVMFSSRNPDQLLTMTRQLGAKASVGTPLQAAEFGEVIVFTVPYAAIPQLAEDLKQAMRGKVVIDATNPSGYSNDPLAREAYTNGVALTSAKLLPNTRLVRAFSSVDATAVESSYNRTSNKLAVPIASDDTQAIKIVEQLVYDAGCEPLIVGKLADAKSYQRGGPGFRLHTTLPELRQKLGLTGNN